MKLDVKLDHNNNSLFGATGISDERAGQINRLVERLLKAAATSTGISKSKVIEEIIEFADTTVEAVLIYGFYESRFTELNTKQELLNLWTLCRQT